MKTKRRTKTRRTNLYMSAEYFIDLLRDNDMLAGLESDEVYLQGIEFEASRNVIYFYLGGIGDEVVEGCEAVQVFCGFNHEYNDEHKHDFIS